MALHRKFSVNTQAPPSGAAAVGHRSKRKRAKARRATSPRYRVFGLRDGRICFINAFPDRTEAQLLVAQLDRRYGGLVEFWWGDRDQRADVTWPEMRASLELPEATPRRRRRWHPPKKTQARNAIAEADR